MELVDGFSWAWAGWIGSFLVIEGIALARKDKGDTLSEHVWKIFKVEKGKGFKGMTWRRGLLGAFMAWLSVHFLFGI
jgi:hypothetical protein